MTPDEFRHHGHALIDWLADHHAGRDTLPVQAITQPGEIRAQLPAGPPDAPEPFGKIIADLQPVGLL